MKPGYINHKKVFLFLMASIVIVTKSFAQVTLGTSPYTENFNSVGSGLPAGWSVFKSATATSLGTIGTFVTAQTAWSNSAGQFANCASASAPATSADNATTQNANTNRAPAVRESSTFGDLGMAFALQLANTSGSTNFSLTFKLMELDPSTTAGRTATWNVDYGFGIAPTSFTNATTSPAVLTTTLNGWGSTTVNVNFGSVLDNYPGTVWIRIVTKAATSGTGSRPFTAIDDFSLAWSGSSCINPTIPVLSSSANPVCIGSSSTLSITSGNLNSATSWQWHTGSCGGSSAGTGTSITVNPSATTTYYVRGEGGCVSPGTCAQLTITVSIPTPAASCSSPLCTGSTLNLFAGGGTTYSWTGPNGFTSSLQNPVITNISSGNAGLYTVLVTNANGCSASAGTTLTVNSLPVITASGNSPVCSGSTLNLFSSGGINYSWTGPNGFSSSLQNPTIPNVSSLVEGNYLVQGTDANGCSDTAAPVSVIFNNNPSNGILFLETMGSVGGTTLISAHETANGFDYDSLTMSGSAEVRNTSPSTGYGTGLPAASGLANIFFTNTVGKNFIIAEINTSGISNPELSFGISKSTNTGTGSDLLVMISSNGTLYDTLSFPPLPSTEGNSFTKWYYRVASGNIPSVPNLRIQFKENGTTTQYRIDDVSLHAVVPSISANGPTTFCTGDSVKLTSVAGNNYVWNNGETSQSITVHNSGVYSVTINCLTSVPVTVTVNPCTVTLNMKAFFEGFYSGRDSMFPVIDSTLYPSLFDSVTVVLHDTTTLYAPVDSVKGVLSILGIGNFVFQQSISGHSYYIAIRHRNSLETWSKSPVTFNSTNVSFDFTRAESVIVNNPVPVLNSISPSSATAGSSGFTMTLSGSNFIANSSVFWNGAPLSFSYLSSTQLTAIVPASYISIAGTVTVTVYNNSPGGGESAGQTFTINASNPIPVLNSISPSSAIAGASGFTMTLSGSNFISGSVVKWNSTSLTTTFVNGSQLTAAVPAGNIATAGTVSVTVFNPTPGGGTSGVKTFTINPASGGTKKFLFDATKAETAGNADWVIDEDGSPQRIPTPTQANIISSTAETYWTGAISSWGIALVKKGHTVETLPSGTAITYGNSSNPQDLSNYNVFVVDEPNILFTSTEKTAILNFVSNGGGLFMVSDHTVSDRNNDGSDSPVIWNDLMTNNTLQTNPFGFSIDLTNISQVSSNVRSNSSTNPILNGTEGNVTQLQFNNGATITINTAANSTVQGLIWQNTFSQSTTHIMSASSTYGTGRIFVVTDSSPIDDGTGSSGTLFDGWTKYSHIPLFMNASFWLAKLQ